VGIFVATARRSSVTAALTVAQRGMVGSRMTEPPESRTVVEEKDALGERLGWLADADNFYRKLSVVRRCLSWLHWKAKV